MNDGCRPPLNPAPLDKYGPYNRGGCGKREQCVGKLHLTWLYFIMLGIEPYRQIGPHKNPVWFDETDEQFNALAEARLRFSRLGGDTIFNSDTKIDKSDNHFVELDDGCLGFYKICI